MTVARDYKLIRKDILDYKARTLEDFGIDLYTWKNPYTRMKSRMYAEFAVPIILLSLKMKISPNFITSIYIILGFLAVISQFSQNTKLNTFAIFLFFFNAVLDWVDGFVARYTQSTSLYGANLDSKAGTLNITFFMLTLTLWVENQVNYTFFYYLAIAIISLQYMLYLINQDEHTPLKLKKESSKSIKEWTESKIYKILIYDGRSRYTDFLLFLCLIYLLYPELLFIVVFPFYWSLVLFSVFVKKVYKISTTS